MHFKSYHKRRKNYYFGSLVLITPCNNNSSSMALTLFPSSIRRDSNPRTSDNGARTDGLCYLRPLLIVVLTICGPENKGKLQLTIEITQNPLGNHHLLLSIAWHFRTLSVDLGRRHWLGLVCSDQAEHLDKHYNNNHQKSRIPDLYKLKMVDFLYCVIFKYFCVHFRY